MVHPGLSHIEAIIQAAVLGTALYHLVLQGLPLCVLLPPEDALLTSPAIWAYPWRFYTHGFGLHKVLTIHHVDLPHGNLVVVLLGTGNDPRLPDAFYLLGELHPLGHNPRMDPHNGICRPKLESIKLSTASTLRGQVANHLCTNQQLNGSC